MFCGKIRWGQGSRFPFGKVEEEEIILSAFQHPFLCSIVVSAFPTTLNMDGHTLIKAGREAEVGPDLCIKIADNHSLSFICSTNTD